MIPNSDWLIKDKRTDTIVGHAETEAGAWLGCKTFAREAGVSELCFGPIPPAGQEWATY